MTHTAKKDIHTILTILRLDIFKSVYNTHTKGGKGMNSKEIIKILKQNGFRLKSQKGSHKKFVKDDKTAVVADHGKDEIPLGTLKNIERQSGLKLR